MNQLPIHLSVTIFRDNHPVSDLPSPPTAEDRLGDLLAALRHAQFPGAAPIVRARQVGGRLRRRVEYERLGTAIPVGLMAWTRTPAAADESRRSDEPLMLLTGITADGDLIPMLDRGEALQLAPFQPEQVLLALEAHARLHRVDTAPRHATR